MVDKSGTGLLADLTGSRLFADLNGSGLLVVLVGSGLRIGLNVCEFLVDKLCCWASADVDDSGFRDSITVFGLLALGARSRLMAGLVGPAGICSIRGEVVADPLTEGLIYFWDEAVRAAGSAAVGVVF